MTRLSWTAAGSGPDLLLIQGLGYPRQMWFRLLPLLAESFRVIAFDNRGIGANAGITVEGLTIEQMADDAAAVLRESGGRAHVLGVSLGGIVAQQLALSHPSQVDHLVLVSTHTCDAHAESAEDEVIRMFATRTQLPPAEARRASVPYAYGPGATTASIEEDLDCRDRHPVAAAVYDAQLRAAHRFEGTWERLPSLACPTLIVHGTDDRIVPPANADLLGARIPRSRREWVHGGGHNLSTEFPSAVADAVLRFTGAARAAGLDGREGPSLPTGRLPGSRRQGGGSGS